MAVEVLDIVALLPARLHRTALALSARLADRMAAQRFPSHFRLGAPFGPGPGGPCEPHVSIFMLAVDDGDIDDVVRVTRRLAADLPALIAAAGWWVLTVQLVPASARPRLQALPRTAFEARFVDSGACRLRSG